MSLANWRPRQERLEEVVVPEEALSEERDPGELPMYVSMFVRHALDTAMYLRDELPREALIAATLADYLAAGGHGQFVSSTCWCAEHRSDIREGLAILGRPEAARVFADFEVFAELEPERFARSSGTADQIDPYFFELDRRFGRWAGAIEIALAAWIGTRPWLRTMPEAEYTRIRGWETPNHRLREERLEERRRGNEKELRRGLLFLQASGRARKAKGWRRLFWRLRKAWYSND